MTEKVTKEDLKRLEDYIKDQWPTQFSYNQVMEVIKKLKRIHLENRT